MSASAAGTAAPTARNLLATATPWARPSADRATIENVMPVERSGIMCGDDLSLFLRLRVHRGRPDGRPRVHRRRRRARPGVLRGLDRVRRHPGGAVGTPERAEQAAVAR